MTSGTYIWRCGTVVVVGLHDEIVHDTLVGRTVRGTPSSLQLAKGFQLRSRIGAVNLEAQFFGFTSTGVVLLVTVMGSRSKSADQEGCKDKSREDLHDCTQRLRRDDG